MLQFLLAITEEGQRGKIEYIFKSFHGDMLSFAMSYIRNRCPDSTLHDAEDAVEDSFIRLTKYIASFDMSSDDNKTKNYIFSILINECNNVLSKKSNALPLNENIITEEGSENEFFETLEISERYEAVVAAIKRLDYKYSSSLYLRFFEEKSVRSISEELGIPEKTVYTRIARARAMLIELLERGEKND